MIDLEVRCPDCGVNATRLPPCTRCGYQYGCCPCVHADERATPLTIADCTCLYSCADDPREACSLSGEWHVHP